MVLPLSIKIFLVCLQLLVEEGNLFLDSNDVMQQGKVWKKLALETEKAQKDYRKHAIMRSNMELGLIKDGKVCILS